MPTTTSTSKISQKTLKAAAGILQGAHDYIEQFGFNIDTYAGGGTQGAPMCYIGTVRHVAGIEPSPGSTDSGAAADGDGPELVLAFQAMDKVAKRRLKPDQRQGVENEYFTEGEYHAQYNEVELEPSFWAIGRFVENLGFEIQTRAERRFPEDPERAHEYERTYALKLLRQALTDLYR